MLVRKESCWHRLTPQFRLDEKADRQSCVGSVRCFWGDADLAEARLEERDRIANPPAHLMRIDGGSRHGRPATASRS